MPRNRVGIALFVFVLALAQTRVATLELPQRQGNSLVWNCGKMSGWITPHGPIISAMDPGTTSSRHRAGGQECPRGRQGPIPASDGLHPWARGHRGLTNATDRTLSTFEPCPMNNGRSIYERWTNPKANGFAHFHIMGGLYQVVKGIAAATPSPGRIRSFATGVSEFRRSWRGM